MAIPPPAPSVTPAELLAQLDACLEAHGRWLQSFHRTLVCRLPPDPAALREDSHLHSQFGRWYAENSDVDLVNQPAFHDLGDVNQRMHAAARQLLIVQQAGNPISEALYDRFADDASAFTRQVRRLARAFSAALSDLDPVTGLQNRQAMLAALDGERQRSARTGAPLSLAIADLDYFKGFNDRHGHAVGDLALTTAAQTFLRHLRPFDGIYRYGGEEFLIALPYADLSRAHAVIERLREELQSTPLALPAGGEERMTASFGVTQLVDGDSIESAIDRADQALYRAKEDGRNRVVATAG